MSNNLDPALINELLAHCYGFAPSATIKSIINNISMPVEGNHEIGLDIESTRFLEELSCYYDRFISPDYESLLRNTKIVVIDEPICNAIAHHELNTIFIFNGLLQTMAFRFELILLTGNLVKHIDELPISLDEFKKLALDSTFLLLHYLDKPFVLPKLWDIFTKEEQNGSFFGYCGGTMFLLLHELGHLTLHGKAEGKSVIMHTPTISVFENINKLKEQELEADNFVYDAFIPEARPMVLGHALYLFLSKIECELYIGGSSATHPFTVNRLANLKSRVGAMDDPVLSKNYTIQYENHLKLFLERINLDYPRLADLPKHLEREVRLKSLRQVLNDVESCKRSLDKLVGLYRTKFLT